MPLDEAQAVVPFRLEDGETVWGGDTDVGFEHLAFLPRFAGRVQLPNTVITAARR